jgi:hypothetical protein
VSVVRFPEERARILPKGRDAAFEVIANWLIEAVSEIAELRARVEALESERMLPRRTGDGEIGEKDDHYA